MSADLPITSWALDVQREAEWLGRVRVTKWPSYRLTTGRDAVPPVPGAFSAAARLVCRAVVAAEGATP